MDMNPYRVPETKEPSSRSITAHAAVRSVRKILLVILLPLWFVLIGVVFSAPSLAIVLGFENGWIFATITVGLIVVGPFATDASLENRVKFSLAGLIAFIVCPLTCLAFVWLESRLQFFKAYGIIAMYMLAGLTGSAAASPILIRKKRTRDSHRVDMSDGRSNSQLNIGEESP